MKPRALALVLTALILTACSGRGLAQVGAGRLPKGTARPGAPAQAITLVPPPTVTPRPTPILQMRAWPAPLTYGSPPTPATPMPAPAQPLLLDPDVVNILLLGSDRRSGRSFRTDTIIVLSIDPDTRSAVLLSIPRDLYVYIPGFTVQRINAAFLYGDTYGYPGGGPAMLADTILYNLGIPIHHYARVEMSGFRQIIDTLGGIDVRVTCPYTDWRLKSPNLPLNDEDNWVLFTVPTGVVHMNGDYALWYARSRMHSSDFDRARRQQEVLRAIYRQALRLQIIPRIPELYAQLAQTITSDMGLADILALAPLAGQVDLARVRSVFIGRDEVISWRTPSGGQVLLPKPEAIRALLERAFDFEQPDPLAPEASTSIEVVNASSRPGWAELAVERLNYAGFTAHLSQVVAGATARTRLIDFGRASPGERERLLAALRLPVSAVVEQAEPASPFSFRLEVGDDYDPCFNPTRDQAR